MGQLLALLDGVDRVGGAVADLVDQLLGILHRLLGVARQLAHLVGHHRKTAPLLAGPGRLDGGVERQQVGLIGDPLDDGEDAGDLLAVVSQPFHHLGVLARLGGHLVHGVDHPLEAYLALVRRALGLLGGVGGVVGVVATSWLT